MGQEFNREQLAGGHTGRSLRKGKSAKVPLRTAPRGLPATVAQDNSDWTPLSDARVDWRGVGEGEPFDGTPPGGAAQPGLGDPTAPGAADPGPKPVLSAMSELRGLLDNMPTYEPLVEEYQPVTAPTASLVTQTTAPESPDEALNPDLERELLSRLGEAASASVRGHSPKPLQGPIENVGDRTYAVGRRSHDVTTGLEHGRPAVAPRIPRAAEPAIAAPSVDAKKLQQVEAENASLKSSVQVIQGTLADLERSVQHQLSALEERIVAALQRMDTRQPDGPPPAYVDPDAIEARIVARLQPFDAATVEQRLAARIESLEPEVLEQRVAARLAALDPTAVEERIVTRLQAGGVRSLAGDGDLSPEILEALEERIHSKLTQTQTAVLDQRLADQLRNLDPALIENRVRANVPSHADLAVLEGRLAELAEATPDLAKLDERLDQRVQAVLADAAPSRIDIDALERRIDDKLIALAADRPTIDLEGLEKRIDGKLETLANERPAVDVVALEGRIEQRLQTALAEYATQQPTVDVEAMESRFDHKLTALAAERPVVDVDALTAGLESQFDAKLKAFADSQPEIDVDGLEAHINEKLESFVAAQPVVDLVAFEAQIDAKLDALTAAQPVVDVDSLEARLTAKLEDALAAQPTVDIDGLRAQVEALAASQQHVDVDALEARIVDQIPDVDVETIALRARELISAHDLVPLNAAIADLGGHLRQKTVETYEALNKVEVRVAARLQESVDAEARVAAQLAQLDQRNTTSEREVESRLNAMEDRIADQADDLKLEVSGLSAALFQQVDMATDKLADAGEEKIAAVLVQVEQSSAAVLQKLEESSKQQADAAQARIAELEGRVNEQLSKMSNSPHDIEPIRERIGRIGLELAAATDEHNTLKEVLDKRLAGIESANEILTAKVIESSSVDIAVYLDRIAEIERAISELDPDRFALAEEVQALADRLSPMPPPASRP